MIETDVLVVGAGPAGLATAIALKRRGFGGRVVVVDKGRSVGSHVLSGAVMDPSGFEGLLTDEELSKLPVEAHVKRESFRFILGQGVSVRIPWVPPMMQAEGFPVGSLTKVVQYLASVAMKLGVEIYTGYAITGLVEEDGVVVGARTGEKGVDLLGKRKTNYLASEEIRAKVTVLAEGGAGILTDRLVAAKGLSGRRPQSYALGIKELIALPAPDGRAGTIMHTFGYPVDMVTYGGGFVYHVSDTQVMVGYALGLDYRDAALDAHALFRRFKATKAVQAHIAGGKAVAYGAKMIPEGGFYAMPKPYAPGVLIVGDGAGLLDGLRIKGIHIAMQSGRAAAEAIAENCRNVGLADCRIGERYFELLQKTKGYREVKRVRNVHGGFTYGAPFGVMMAGFAWATFGAFPFWMFGKCHRDSQTLHPQPPTPNHQPPIANTQCPIANSQLFPDRLTDVFMSGTIHEENQPCHLKIADAAKCAECATRYGCPCTRFCPAEVYREEEGKIKVDFSNCLHCKTCKVKCPYGNVEWTFPQGGDGPRYTRM